MLSNALEKTRDALIENREELSVMSENGRAAVLNEWNWTSQEKKLLNLYKSLI